MMIKTKLFFKLKSTSNAKEIELDKTFYSIGREKDCDILLEQGYPSRMHAQIIFKDGELLLDDLNSTNGTFVNGKRINKTTPIRHGDVISFSTEEFTLLSSHSNSETIISKRLSTDKHEDSFIVVEEAEFDPNETAFQQDYPLPAGWPVNDTQFTKLFHHTPKTPQIDKLDQKIKDALSNEDTVYIAALIFNPDDENPIIFGLSIESQQYRLSIGRRKECTFTINSPSVSEHHANLIFKNGKWHISDNTSTNGIRKNMALVSEFTLEHGTTLSLGQVKMVFRVIPWAL